jgi:hypothetical protein
MFANVDGDLIKVDPSLGFIGTRGLAINTGTDGGSLSFSTKSIALMYLLI